MTPVVSVCSHFDYCFTWNHDIFSKMSWLTRTCSVVELTTLAPLCAEFAASSKFVKDFDFQRFTAMWTGLIESGNGVIFVAGEPILGMIGGVAFPEPYSDRLIATEFFWFVKADMRGPGVALYRAFEQWARESGCDEIRMVHLQDSMPERVAKFYEGRGYKKTETMYSKGLQ